ncbi:hypothetical protein BDQ12DRAFT_471049 [Crucibulum laeve]|uniref:Uncharacterized protein n=1 Tax=Crucibulum laeve TaxID=68775 RepID=A0A5C3LJK8_9AGAR|nr:hypothetical protein BDQ12DRAFT_471049 [Crucibulum laeve]
MAQKSFSPTHTLPFHPLRTVELLRPSVDRVLILPSPASYAANKMTHRRHARPRFLNSTSSYDPVSNAISNLTMMQMIADAYEDARVIWDENKVLEMKEDSDPGLYGPNDAQKSVEDWLVWAHFIPRASRHHPKAPQIEEPAPASQPKSSSSFSNAATLSSPLRRYLKIVTPSVRKQKFVQALVPASAARQVARVVPKTVTSLLHLRSKSNLGAIPPPLTKDAVAKPEVPIAPYKFTPRKRFEYRNYIHRRTYSESRTIVPCTPTGPQPRRKCISAPSVLQHSFPYSIPHGLLTPQTDRAASFEGPSSYSSSTCGWSHPVLRQTKSIPVVPTERTIEQTQKWKFSPTAMIKSFLFDLALNIFVVCFFTITVLTVIYFVAHWGKSSLRGDEEESD